MAYKYCEKTTKSHPKYEDKFAKPLSVAIKDEGGPNVGFHSIVVDLDAMEKENALRQKRNKMSTMDIFFGVSQAVTQKSPQICLVDFKYRVKGKSDFDINDCKQKIKESIAMLGRDVMIHANYYFVFSENNQVKRNILYRKNMSNPNSPMKFINTDTFIGLFW